MSDFLKNFKIDRWFKAIMYLGGLAFLYSLFGETKWLTNESVGLLGLALFFIGLGEWKNEKVAVGFKPPSVYTGPAGIFQYPVRKSDLIGNLFLIVGFVFLLILFLKLIFS